MVVSNPKKSTPWNETAIKIMRNNLGVGSQRLIFEISLYTGEKIGSIVQLKVEDVYNSDGSLKEQITFRKLIRKKKNRIEERERKSCIHEVLREQLIKYAHPETGYLFPSWTKCGHLSVRAVDKRWREILSQYNFTGFTTLSSRKYVINQLKRNGIETDIISKAIGLNPNAVRAQLEPVDSAPENAIATLAV